jgi:hypothetical protein
VSRPWCIVSFGAVMSRIISEDVLRAIAEALRIHAPHLRHTILKLVQGGLIDGPEGRHGSSIYGKLTATISWEEAEPILRALQTIESERGYRTLFAGRQINWLVVCWQQFAEPRQLTLESPTSPTGNGSSTISNSGST